MSVWIPSHYCIYCGGPAEEWEHVVPRSLIKIYDGVGILQREYLVRSCESCNRTVSDRIFRTLKEKMEWLRKRRSLPLSMPWDELLGKWLTVDLVASPLPENDGSIYFARNLVECDITRSVEKWPTPYYTRRKCLNCGETIIMKTRRFCGSVCRSGYIVGIRRIRREKLIYKYKKCIEENST